MESTDSLQLLLPDRNLDSLSFCPGDSGSASDRLEGWLNALSITDYQKNGENLTNALEELTRLDCPPDQLFTLAEAVRSPCLSTAVGLYQRYLKRFITFESGQQPWFDLCRRLHMGLAMVYKAAVQCCLDHGDHGERLAAALHRAISESASTYLFHCLLYRPVPERLWLELHSLYQLATVHNYQGFRQEDPYDNKGKLMSAENLYKRALLLSRSDTNKLSPGEIQKVWHILNLWIDHCKIQPRSGLKTYFSAHLNSDKGLEYAAPEPDKVRAGVIGLNVRVLTAHLKQIKKDSVDGKALPARLVEHLLLSWGQIKKRSSPRKAYLKASLACCETCFGFTGLHYHLSGNRNFDDIITIHSESAGKSNFSERSDDVWSRAHDAGTDDKDKPGKPSTGGAIAFNTEEFLENKRLSALQTGIINTSHTGFCLKVNGKLPQPFHAGELVGIRQDDGVPWALYSVRWLGISTQSDVTFGVNLITTSVDAAAISLVHKTREASHFQRAFLLSDPEESSLIVPNLSDKEGVKFELIHNDILQKGQLVKCIYTTPTWCQYSFRLFG